MRLKPVVPFEPVSTDSIPSGEQWTAQVKWDGVRILTYSDGTSTRLYNRKLNERTMQYPEFLCVKDYCLADSVILDGEIIALEDGKPSFQKVMKRDAIRQADKVKEAARQTEVFYMVFDILYHNGDWVVELPLNQRQKLLQEIIKPGGSLQLVENFTDPQSLFDIVKGRDMEGVVIKDLQSKYAIGGKDGRWQKLKHYRDLVAFIGGVTYRGDTVNSLLLGIYGGEGGLRYIGRAGTGKLSRSQWAELTEDIKPLIINNSPFANKPPGGLRDAVWVRPVMAARVHFSQWSPGHIVRQASIQGIIK